MAARRAARLSRRRAGRRQDVRDAQRGPAPPRPRHRRGRRLRRDARPTAHRSSRSRDLEVVPRQRIEYRGATFEEMDVDAILARQPAGRARRRARAHQRARLRNEKRWQDVEELLDAGIDVISTVNIQHLESVNDVVERITGVQQRETVPDDVVRAGRPGRAGRHDARGAAAAHGARQHLPAGEGRRRARRTTSASGNLAALRELALLWVADRVDDELQRYREDHGITEPWETQGAGRRRADRRARWRAPGAPRARAWRRASKGELLGVHVRAGRRTAARPTRTCSNGTGELLEDLGGRTHEIVGADVAAALVGVRPGRERDASSCSARAGARAGPSSCAARSSTASMRSGRRHRRPRHLDRATPRTRGGHRPAADRLDPRSVRPRRSCGGWLLAQRRASRLRARAHRRCAVSSGFPARCSCFCSASWSSRSSAGSLPAARRRARRFLARRLLLRAPDPQLRSSDGATSSRWSCSRRRSGRQPARRPPRAHAAVEVARLERRPRRSRGSAGDAVLSQSRAAPDAGRRAAPHLRPRRRSRCSAPEDGGWDIVAAAGDAVAGATRRARRCPRMLAEATVLVLSGASSTPRTARLLRAFVAQLRLAQERAALEAEAAATRSSSQRRTACAPRCWRQCRTTYARHSRRSRPPRRACSRRGRVGADERELREDDRRGDRSPRRSSSANLLDMSRLQAGALRPRADRSRWRT